MSKSIGFNYSALRIETSSTSAADAITFDDITTYFAANPISPIVQPMLYGGYATILGDKNTFTGAAGDKLKITINGVVIDNIAVNTATNIASVVNLINAAVTANTYNQGTNVADSSGGFLRLRARCKGSIGDITIADGTLTTNPCVQKLFNTAARTLSTTTAPFELTEGNSSQWTGQNGMGTPAADTVSFAYGAESLKTTFAGGTPAAMNVNRIIKNGIAGNVFMPSVTGLNVGDEIEIVGTTNFNGMKLRIVSVSVAGLYVYGYMPGQFPNMTEGTGSTTIGTLIRRPQIAWNETYSISYRTISESEKIKFSIKTDSATAVLKGIIVRNYYGSGTPANFHYGGYLVPNATIPTIWTDMEYNLRDLILHCHANNGDRGYFSQFAKLYFQFDGLAVGESVWIDGVRFIRDNPSPVKEKENIYTFYNQRYVSDYFKDWGFTAIRDTLETALGSGSFAINATATVKGRIQFGDYDGAGSGYFDREGGIFVFNHLSSEDTGAISFNKCQLQAISFMDGKNKYGGYQHRFCTNNDYRDCHWNNMLNFFAAEEGSNIVGCSMTGGRYAFGFPAPNCNIDDFTCYGTPSYQFFMRATNVTRVIKNVKIIDGTSQKQVIGADSYPYDTGAGDDCGAFYNLDVSECNNPRLILQTLAIHYPRNPTIKIGITMDLKIVDGANAINGATVTLKDKDNNVVFTQTTSATGVITQQNVDVLKARLVSSPTVSLATNYSFDTPLVDWIRYYPFTLSVSKEGYETYSEVILPTYSKSDNMIKKGLNKEITLKTAVPLLLSPDEAFIKLNPENIGEGRNLIA